MEVIIPSQNCLTIKSNCEEENQGIGKRSLSDFGIKGRREAEVSVEKQIYYNAS